MWSSRYCSILGKCHMQSTFTNLNRRSVVLHRPQTTKSRSSCLQRTGIKWCKGTHGVHWLPHAREERNGNNFEYVFIQMTSQTFFCNFISLKNTTFFKNMPWQQYLQYLQDYAQHFDLTPRIQFNTRVTKVTSTADYSETGRYIYIKGVCHN